MYFNFNVTGITRIRIQVLEDLLDDLLVLLISVEQKNWSSSSFFSLLHCQSDVRFISSVPLGVCKCRSTCAILLKHSFLSNINQMSAALFPSAGSCRFPVRQTDKIKGCKNPSLPDSFAMLRRFLSDRLGLLLHGGGSGRRHAALHLAVLFRGEEAEAVPVLTATGVRDWDRQRPSVGTTIKGRGTPTPWARTRSAHQAPKTAESSWCAAHRGTPLIWQLQGLLHKATHTCFSENRYFS